MIWRCPYFEKPPCLRINLWTHPFHVSSNVDQHVRFMGAQLQIFEDLQYQEFCQHRPQLGKLNFILFWAANSSNPCYCWHSISQSGHQPLQRHPMAPAPWASKRTLSNSFPIWENTTFTTYNGGGCLSAWVQTLYPR